MQRLAHRVWEQETPVIVGLLNFHIIARHDIVQIHPVSDTASRRCEANEHAYLFRVCAVDHQVVHQLVHIDWLLHLIHVLNFGLVYSSWLCKYLIY